MYPSDVLTHADHYPAQKPSSDGGIIIQAEQPETRFWNTEDSMLNM
jgi:hypothetical protein